MVQKDRLEQTGRTVCLEKRVAVANLSNQFGVTPETTRRDLEKLEEEGLVVRTYGGVVLNQTEFSKKIDFVKCSEANAEEKRAIAGIVSEMVPPNASIGCDASSTVMETLKYLGEREDILVLTNSVKVIREMERSRFGTLSTGGCVNRQFYSMQGGVARSAIQEYHLDMVPTSCKGMSMEDGVFGSRELETDVKKPLTERGHRVYLLAGYSRFGRVAFMKLTDLGQIDVVVTDRKPFDGWMWLFSRNHVEAYHS